MTIIIHRQILRRLNKLSLSIDNLISQFSNLKKNKKDLTVSIQSFIEKSIKNRKLVNQGILTTGISNISNSKNNYFLLNKAELNEKINSNISKIKANEYLINSNSKSHFEDNSFLSFNADNLIKDRDKSEEISNTYKMFSVSNKINNPMFFDDQEDDISISDVDEDTNSYEGESQHHSEKALILNQGKNLINKRNKSHQIKKNLTDNKLRTEFNLDDIICYTNKQIKTNEIINENRDVNKLKTPLNRKIKPQILVHNINNINNINIVSSDICQLHNINDLNNLNLINKKTSLKRSSNLTLSYNKEENRTRNNNQINGISFFLYIITLFIF